MFRLRIMNRLNEYQKEKFVTDNPKSIEIKNEVNSDTSDEDTCHPNISDKCPDILDKCPDISDKHPNTKEFDEMYYKKYLKYRSKFLNLKNQTRE